MTEFGKSELALHTSTFYYLNSRRHKYALHHSLFLLTLGQCLSVDEGGIHIPGIVLGKHYQ